MKYIVPIIIEVITDLVVTNNRDIFLLWFLQREIYELEHKIVTYIDWKSFIIIT